MKNKENIKTWFLDDKIVWTALQYPILDNNSHVLMTRAIEEEIAQSQDDDKKIRNQIKLAYNRLAKAGYITTVNAIRHNAVDERLKV